MGYRERGAEWELLRGHLPQFLGERTHLLEMAPGKVSRSLVRQVAEPLIEKYWFADLNNRNREHPGFVEMRSEFIIDGIACRFDVVVAYQCLHNVRKPWRWFTEIARVVCEGGLVFVIDSVTENCNRHPLDCGRWFPDGMESLYEEAGLKMTSQHMMREDLSIIEPGEEFGRAFGERLLTTARKPYSRDA